MRGHHHVSMPSRAGACGRAVPAAPAAARIVALVAALAIPLAASAPALAQGGAAGPPVMPTRDVMVTYAVQPEGAPQPQMVKVWFQAGGNLMRLDGPPGPPDGSPSGFMVTNRAARSMLIVFNQPRVFMEVPETPDMQAPFVLDASMRFTPTGSGTVAGLPCNRYAIVAGSAKADACVTADGVVLSESGVDGQGNRGSLVARSVQYGALAPSLFVPPPGFQRTAHPAQDGAPGMPPGPPAQGGAVGAPGGQ